MTINEAIIYAEEMAATDGNRKRQDNYNQIAEWLKDYKRMLQQEPCEDAISRQAVLDGLASIAKVKAKSDAQKALMGRVMFFTEQLPPVTPTACIAKVTFDKDELQKIVDEKVKELTLAQEWIPVSERLPEVNQRVLVTSYGRVCYAMMISADGNNGYPIFRLQDSLNERVVCETTVHSKFTASRIVAWMPLPEPYKAESEEV